MKKKTVAKQKATYPAIYKLILILSVLLALTSIFVALHLQNQMSQMALQEQIYFMQK